MTTKDEIAELINGWAFFRDQERWDELLDVFHEDGSISLSWIDGPYAQFVEASKRIAARGGSVLKHNLGVPMISVQGRRAIAEVNVTIMVRATTPAGEVDATSFARFFDLVEKREGPWKILRRVAIYEKDRADPVDQPALPAGFFEGLDEFPHELRFLGKAMKAGGIDLSKTVVLDKSPALEKLYRDGVAWLAQG